MRITVLGLAFTLVACGEPPTSVDEAGVHDPDTPGATTESLEQALEGTVGGLCIATCSTNHTADYEDYTCLTGNDSCYTDSATGKSWCNLDSCNELAMHAANRNATIINFRWYT